MPIDTQAHAPAPAADMVLVPRSVLAPFANAARTFSGAIGPDGIDDELTVLARVHAMHGTEAHLSTGDFSRVASALAASPTPTPVPVYGTPLAGEAGADDWAQREAYRKGFEDGGRIERERADFLEEELERLRAGGEAGAVEPLRTAEEIIASTLAEIDGRDYVYPADMEAAERIAAAPVASPVRTDADGVREAAQRAATEVLSNITSWADDEPRVLRIIERAIADGVRDDASRRVNAAYASMRADNDARRKAEKALAGETERADRHFEQSQRNAKMVAELEARIEKMQVSFAETCQRERDRAEHAIGQQLINERRYQAAEADLAMLVGFDASDRMEAAALPPGGETGPAVADAPTWDVDTIAKAISSVGYPEQHPGDGFAWWWSRLNDASSFSQEAREEDRKKAQAVIAALTASPSPSERDQQQGETIARLERERDEARAQTSAVAKLLSDTPPYQASLAARVEGLLHQVEVNGGAPAETASERERLVEALQKIAGRSYRRVGYGLTDMALVPNCSAHEASNIARAALSTETGR